jgi:hypothetical protein
VLPPLSQRLLAKDLPTLRMKRFLADCLLLPRNIFGCHVFGRGEQFGAQVPALWLAWRHGNHGMSHIAITEQLDGRNTEWMEKVPDEQYRQ